MPRYFARIAYKGTGYAGWQRQPNAIAVQEVIENKLSTVFNSNISIVGCGRTDAGVHASDYIFHFDVDQLPETDLVHKLNRMLPDDIAIFDLWPVDDKMHARFDAKSRTYMYYLSRNKDPFNYETVTYYPYFKKLDKERLTLCAKLIAEYNEFFPFCKSRSDTETMFCNIYESSWQFDDEKFIYTISANRFLRGMVRLIVGISLRVGIGEVDIDVVREALANQTRIVKSWSAPPEGLFLHEIEY